MTDHYSGEVTPGGEPDRRTAGSLEITKLAVDPQMHNNCYLPPPTTPCASPT